MQTKYDFPSGLQSKWGLRYPVPDARIMRSPRQPEGRGERFQAVRRASHIDPPLKANAFTYECPVGGILLNGLQPFVFMPIFFTIANFAGNQPRTDPGQPPEPVSPSMRCEIAQVEVQSLCINMLDSGVGTFVANDPGHFVHWSLLVNGNTVSGYYDRQARGLYYNTPGFGGGATTFQTLRAPSHYVFEDPRHRIHLRGGDVAQLNIFTPFGLPAGTPAFWVGFKLSGWQYAPRRNDDMLISTIPAE